MTLLPIRGRFANQSQAVECPLRQLGPSAPRLLGIFRGWAFSGFPLLPRDPVLLLAVISRVSLQPLPGPAPFRKPASSGSVGNPDSARKSPAWQRTFEKRFRGSRASRRARRSVSARSGASAVRRAGPAGPEDDLATLASAAGLAASCVSGWSQCVSGFPERQ